ncbi:hypothetical protein [Asticcacaulis solisilvae]|uniref:hypothetical protein n=1 Tax=Asticcacaulis solisilvae TaxID=1217274 RepID=UPI003FD798E5
MDKAYRFNFYIDADQRVLVVRLIGAMPAHDFLTRLFEAYDTVVEPWTYNRIMDFRRFRGLLSSADIAEMGRRWMAMAPSDCKRTRLAIVGSGLDHAAGSPAVCPNVPNRLVCHFSDYHLARDWAISTDEAAEPGDAGEWAVIGADHDLSIQA